MFADGNQLKFQSTGKTSWSYTKNGKDAVKGFYYIWNDQKHYVVQLDDSTMTSPVVPAILLEYGMGGKHVYHNKKTAAIIAVVGVSSMLAIMRLALDDDDGY